MLTITPVINSNGEIAQAVETPMGTALALLGFDFITKLTEKSAKGGKALGLGTFKLFNTDNIIDNYDKASNLWVYLYNKTDGFPHRWEKVPSFLNAKCEATASAIIARASNTIDPAVLATSKDGLTIERSGVFNVPGQYAGITYNWPAGQGTGAFDSVCVSLVNLEKLQDNSAITSDANRQPVFAGTMVHTDTAQILAKSCCYVRNGVSGVTDENTILIKRSGISGVYAYNLATGEETRYTGDYAGYFSPWGQAQYVIDSVLYGITSGDTTTESSASNAFGLFSYNLTTKTPVTGSLTSYTLTESTRFLKVGTDLYLQVKEDRSYTEVDSYYTPMYCLITKSTLAVTTTALTLTVPAYLLAHWNISSNDDGTFMLHDWKALISYKFTDLANIFPTISEPFFVGCGQELAIGSGATVEKMFMSALAQGFYQSSGAADTLMKNTSYAVMKYMLLNGSIGPIIAYGAYSKTYTKGAETILTTDIYTQIARDTGV